MSHTLENSSPEGSSTGQTITNNRHLPFFEDRPEYIAWLDGLELVVLSKDEHAGFQVSRLVGDRILIVDQDAFTLRPQICAELWSRVFTVQMPKSGK